jgi:hypothetical protein
MKKTRSIAHQVESSGDAALDKAFDMFMPKKKAPSKHPVAKIFEGHTFDYLPTSITTVKKYLLESQPTQSES